MMAPGDPHSRTVHSPDPGDCSDFDTHLSRRRLLAMAATASLALGAPSLVRAASSEAAGTKAGSRKKGGTAVIAPGLGTAYPHTFIPIAYYGSLAFEASKLVYTPLVLLDNGWNKTLPGLAASWTWTSDAKHVTMHLRKGVKFHDGVEFTAKDVDFTYKLMIRRETYPALQDITLLEGAADYQKMKTEKLAGLDVIDNYTVRFNLSSPSLLFLRYVSDTGILPAHAFPRDTLASRDSTEKLSFFTTKPIGTGPFMVQALNPKTNATLVANKRYFKGAPLLDGIVLRFDLAQGTAMLAALEAGHVDSAYIDPTTAHTLRGNPNVKLETSYALATEQTLTVACEKPYMNVKVRQALLSALDINLLIRTILYGFGRPAPSLMMYAPLFPNPALPTFAYNPARAKQLLQEGHWDPSRKLVYGVYSTQASQDPTSGAILNMFKAVGVQAEFKVLDPANQIHLDFTKHHVYDVASEGFGWLAYDPSFPLQQLTCGTTTNAYNWCNPRFDALMTRAVRATTQESEINFFRQAQVILQNELPSVPLWIAADIWALNRRMHGGVLGRGPLNDIAAETWWKE